MSAYVTWWRHPDWDEVVISSDDRPNERLYVYRHGDETEFVRTGKNGPDIGPEEHFRISPEQMQGMMSYIQGTITSIDIGWDDEEEDV